MDQKIFAELARAWRAHAEQLDRIDQAMPAGESGARVAGEWSGKARQLYDCAEQLESVLSIYAPLSR